MESLTELFDLALDGNEISDISALSGLAHLNQAGLSDNRISDLSPLAGKQELMFASVSGNAKLGKQHRYHGYGDLSLLEWGAGAGKEHQRGGQPLCRWL